MRMRDRARVLKRPHSVEQYRGAEAQEIRSSVVEDDA